jgi:glycosyltransferase involved in cell wall biosynthesis
MKEHSIAVIIPCYNEAIAITSVIRDFKKALPNATIYVYDNNSSDETSAVARAAGAIVRLAPFQGKGNVVRQMFADIEADIYVLTDGDGTYDAPSAPSMISNLIEGSLDMVVGVRESTQPSDAYRRGHQFGNRMFNLLLSTVFDSPFSDILSGFRVFSRRFVKSFPALSSGFEIETEFSLHSIEMKLPTKEIETPYYNRPEGSHSKLNTYRDGLRILITIGRLTKEIFPLRFFTSVALFFAICSLVLGLPVIFEWLESGLVPRFPTAILATGIAILATLSLACGIILDSVSRSRLENKRLAYLAIPGPDQH